MTHACQACGAGAEKVGPIKLSSRLGMLKDAANTLDFDLLLAPQVALKLQELGVANLASVQHWRTGEILPAMELRPERSLPPFSPMSTGYLIEGQCEVCKRDGHFSKVKAPYGLHYESLPEFFKIFRILTTFERFGNSRLRTPFSESHIAAGVFIVREDIVNVLRSIAPRAFTFEEVTISWG
jgi:hypothetical protein